MDKSTRYLLLGLGGMVLAAAGALTGASLYFYHLSVRRNEKRFLMKSPDLPHFKTKLQKEAVLSIPLVEETAVFPGAGNGGRQDKLDDGAWLLTMPTETWSISSEDGLSLTAKWLPAGTASLRVAILAHGYSSSGRDMAGFARLFHTLGYHVLFPDARGHGDSGGDYIGFGWHDRLDIVQWTHTAISRLGQDCKLVLFGISMGGATVLMASGEELPGQVRAIIEDCGYTSAHDQLAFQLKRMYHLPATPLMQTTSLVTKYLAGYGFEEASALEQVKKCQLPILFIHGTEDTFVPTSMVHELYAACTTERELILVEGAGHGMAYSTDPAGYTAQVTAFLNRHL